MMDFLLPAALIALFSLIPIVTHHRLARARLLLQDRLAEEQREADEALDMRTAQRERETNREHLREVRAANREWFRLEREFEDGDEPWKRR